MSDIKDIIVIGAGASGMTAALYALRNGKSVLVLEQETVGGQISNSPRVENFPSIKEISGSDFSDKLFEQITNLGADFELEKVEKVEKGDDGLFTVTTDYAQRKARAVILAVGVKHRHTGVAGEEELIGNGISYCALCDGAFYKGEDIALIGDANTALQYALLLSNYCPTVNVFALFDHLFGDQILIQRINDNPNINVTYNVSLQEFIVQTNNVFVAIGQIPCNEPFKDLVELDSKGFVITNDNMETSCAGVYAVGDTRVKDIRQVVTALGDASVASVYLNRYIQSLNRND